MPRAGPWVSGVRGDWFSSLSWRPWSRTPPSTGHSSQLLGTEGAPSGDDPAPRRPLSCSADPGSQWQRQVGWDGGGGGLGSQEPGTFLAPAQGRRGVGAPGAQRVSVGPPLTPTPPRMGTSEGWNSSNELGHPPLPGRGSREGAGERAVEATASFPLGCCLHPGGELALGFAACSPGQVCQERPPRGSTAPSALTLLGLGQEGRQWRRTLGPAWNRVSDFSRCLLSSWAHGNSSESKELQSLLRGGCGWCLRRPWAGKAIPWGELDSGCGCISVRAAASCWPRGR